MKTLIWFRNDLRIHDNEALYEAVGKGVIIPIYIFDERQFGETSFGFKKTGKFRAQFLIESVTNLRKSFRELGGELIVKMGKAEEIIPALVKKYEVDSVHLHEEITDEEINIEDKLDEILGEKLSYFWGSTLYHMDDIPFSQKSFPDVFTKFRSKSEKVSEVREEYEIPNNIKFLDLQEEDINPLPELKDLGLEVFEADSNTAFPFKGGEEAALNHLKKYVWEDELLKTYKDTRNGLVGKEYSSKLSPWLANGSISPRRIYWEVNKYEKEKVKNDSTYWLIFELIWRDYFRFSAWKYGNQIFQEGGIQEKNRKWEIDLNKFEKWKSGNTGIPFIDANMRELNRTGFMSNRGRQNVASFLAQNLNLDWRMGAEYFESLLLDYDPCSNYGNWAYNATVGHDPRNRYFNILFQADRYDKKGEFVRTWVEELKDLPDNFVHEPWKMLGEQQSLFGVEIGNVYQEPMLDLEESYKEIKKRD